MKGKNLEKATGNGRWMKMLDSSPKPTRSGVDTLRLTARYRCVSINQAFMANETKETVCKLCSSMYHSKWSIITS